MWDSRETIETLFIQNNMEQLTFPGVTNLPNGLQERINESGVQARIRTRPKLLQDLLASLMVTLYD